MSKLNRVAAVLGAVGSMVMAFGCSANVDESTDEQTASQVSAFEANPSAPALPPPNPTTAPPPASGSSVDVPARCGTLGGTPVACAADACSPGAAMPEMVHLVNLILQYQGATQAFVRSSTGVVVLTNPNAVDQAALDAVRTRFNAEMAGKSPLQFDDLFLRFRDRLQRTAEPAFESGVCGALTPYFAVSFGTSKAELEALGHLDLFFKWSQHTYLPSQPCTASWLADNGFNPSVPRVCAFADPNWSTGDSSPAAWAPRVYSGVVGATNWASSGGASYTVTADPDLGLVEFTVYRAVGVPDKLVLGDTAAFSITYAGASEGTWKGEVVGGTTTTGSKATFRLIHRL